MSDFLKDPPDGSVLHIVKPKRPEAEVIAEAVTNNIKKLDFFKKEEKIKEEKIPEVVPIPLGTPLPILPINELSTISQVKRADMEIATVVLEGLSIAWKRACNIDDICKLSLTTMKTLEHRRKLLCMQYGAEAGKITFGGFVEPLD